MEQACAWWSGWTDIEYTAATSADVAAAIRQGGAAHVAVLEATMSRPDAALLRLAEDHAGELARG